jgi:hypothetical protein
MRENVVRLVCVHDQAVWTRDDLAQLHRAAGALRHFGRSLETEGGVTDEGEPWFAICHAESGEVITHFARISGTYVVCAPFLRGSLRGGTLPELIEQFLGRYRAIGLGADDCDKPLYRRGR